MKAGLFLACAALAAAGGLSAQSAEAATAKAHTTKAKARDWSLVVAPTAAGGFVMGNPDAKVKLIEYGSMTCPHCAHFDEEATPALIEEFVKTGDVSFEFRNFVRDAMDVSASLLARCSGAKRFFPVTRAMFKDQQRWEKKIGSAPQEQLSKLDELPANKKFVEAAKVAGLQQWGVAHGIPLAKSTQCLTNEKSIDQLVQMASDATTQYPDFKGTPSFVINGTMVEFGQITAAEVWPTLEAQIKSAIAGQQPTSSTNGA
jgi:protein-disulfide isomerase